MKINRQDLIYDIRNLAFVTADICEDTESPHTLHQTFDICEEGNISRVDNLLSLAAAEVASAIAPIGSLSSRKGGYTLCLRQKPPHTEKVVTELTREYMVACVLYGWLSVTLPAKATFWKARREDTMASIEAAVVNAAVAGSLTLSRRLSPF